MKKSGQRHFGPTVADPVGAGALREFAITPHGESGFRMVWIAANGAIWTALLPHPGSAWGTPDLAVPSNGHSASRQFLSIGESPSGAAIIAWTYTNGATVFTPSYVLLHNGSTTWSSIHALPQPPFGDGISVVAATAHTFVVTSSGVLGTIDINSSATTKVPHPAAAAAQALLSVAAGGDGTLAATWIKFTNPLTGAAAAYVSVRKAGTTTWSTPKRLSSIGKFSYTQSVGVGADGTVTAVWTETDLSLADPLSPSIDVFRAATLHHTGGWSSPTTLDSSGVTQLPIVTSGQKGHVAVTWLEVPAVDPFAVDSWTVRDAVRSNVSPWQLIPDAQVNALPTTESVSASDTGDLTVSTVTFEAGYTLVTPSGPVVVPDKWTSYLLATDLKAPASRTPPAVVGTARTGSTLTCRTGRWIDAAHLQITWYRGQQARPGHSPHYVVTAADVGHLLRCTVVATNPAGTTSVNSAGVLAHLGPALTPLANHHPALTGAPTVGSTLTCHAGSWTPTATAYAYAWLNNGSLISSSHAATLHVAASYVGRHIRCRVTATRPGSLPGLASTPSITIT